MFKDMNKTSLYDMHISLYDMIYMHAELIGTMHSLSFTQQMLKHIIMSCSRGSCHVVEFF